jgi:divalent metal cation (Fe/Co/Zn/Cd) transporter
MAAGGSQRAVVTALLANFGIAVAKFVGFLITGASSMLAESIHSLADTTNQGLLLLGANGP